jgi:hypothetical protein
MKQNIKTARKAMRQFKPNIQFQFILMKKPMKNKGTLYHLK